MSSLAVRFRSASLNKTLGSKLKKGFENELNLTHLLRRFKMPYKDKNKQREAQQKCYLKNKSSYQEGLQARRKRNKEYIQDYKKSGCCKCGEKEILCLEFHHRDAKTKLYNIAKMVNLASSIEKLDEEIKKCDVLCGNCHRELHVKLKDIKYIKTRNWLREYKRTLKCKNCGKKGEDCFACLDFHHRHTSEKIDTVNIVAKKNNFLLLFQEIEKCDVLCVNCHRILHKTNLL